MSQAKGRRKGRPSSCSSGRCATTPSKSGGGRKPSSRKKGERGGVKIQPKRQSPRRQATAPKGAVAEVRLQKWLAEQGVCSRREGEKIILEKRVSINGSIVHELGVKVAPKDEVRVDGRIIQQRRDASVVVMFHKPRGLICTKSDPQGRRTIYELLRTPWPRLISVGRLDLNSEGLLLLTTDGALAHGLMHPSREVPRTYRVKVRGVITKEQLQQLTTEGVELEDGPTGPLDVKLDQLTGGNSWVTMTLKEGRNREIRRIFDSLKLTVARLLRVSYGGVELGELPAGQWRTCTPDEWRALKQASEGSLIGADEGEEGDAAEASAQEGAARDDTPAAEA
uniref:Pseudouridine synthase n=1 Tax=Magnetococcus massalia (strain MO-1) TaxID=451514 RepID=A0A1S7LFM5_MAGMO|nr:16S rRNA uridine-516 pseudouridylate synthase and related pseudouridylate synthases [Candidatus Magnetococcus massalia]